MSDANHKTVASKNSEAGVLFVCALTGASLAVLALMFYEVFLGKPGTNLSGPSSTTSALVVVRPCPLSASPEACDSCMLSACLAPCNACADNPACLQLFDCMMNCKDLRCEATCLGNYSAGKHDLVAFVGQNGCLPLRCSKQCP